MNTENPNIPLLAQALGRLRQPTPTRAWPYAPRPAELTRNPPRTTEPEHDFLRMMPEPALVGDLPPEPAPTAAPTTLRTEGTRPYWFDL